MVTDHTKKGALLRRRSPLWCHFAAYRGKLRGKPQAHKEGVPTVLLRRTTSSRLCHYVYAKVYLYRKSKLTPINRDEPSRSNTDSDRVGYNAGCDEKAGELIFRQRALDVRLSMLDRAAKERAPLSDDSDSAAESECGSDLGHRDKPITSESLPCDADMLLVWTERMHLHPSWAAKIVTPRSLRGAANRNTLRNFLSGMLILRMSNHCVPTWMGDFEAPV